MENKNHPNQQYQMGDFDIHRIEGLFLDELVLQLGLRV